MTLLNKAAISSAGALSPNKSLQRTFDPPRTFAAARARVASNAAELRRQASLLGIGFRTRLKTCIISITLLQHATSIAVNAADRDTGRTVQA